MPRTQLLVPTARRLLSLLALALAPLASCELSDLTDTSDPGASPRTPEPSTPVTPPRELAAVLVADTVLPADGASTTIVTASVPPADTVTGRTVTFSTTLGQLMSASGVAGGTAVATADTGKRARTLLRAARVAGTAVVSASAGRDVIATTVRFANAFPTAVGIDPSGFLLKPDLTENLTITARLSRAVGIPTAGQRVRYVATRLNGDSVGRFRSATLSDDSGVSSARLSAAAGDTGTVVISVIVDGENRSVLTATTIITIRP